MKRILLLAAVAILCWFVGRAIVYSLRSDEWKIRRVILTMAEGFDETRMDPILGGLARDFRDETSGATRQEVREALAYLFFNAKDEATKAFAYRVEFGVKRIAVATDDKGTKIADCEFDAWFLDVRGGKEVPAWDVAITARFVKGEDGWRIASTRYETRSGKMLR